MSRRPDLLARLETAYATPRHSQGVYRLPAVHGNRGQAWLEALAGAPEPPTAAALGPQPIESESGALDTWYRVEDLWLRLGVLRPPALQADREQRCLHWLGLRQLVEPDTLLLRSRAENLHTYQWREAGQRRSLVALLAWEQDHLLVHLMPTRQLQRWAEGDAVADLLRAHLVRHAKSLRQTEGFRAKQMGGAATAWR